MYGVVILTMNEERALPAALASIPDGRPVTVVDSGSTDRAEEIAEAFVLCNPLMGSGESPRFVINGSVEAAASPLCRVYNRPRVPDLDVADCQSVDIPKLASAGSLPPSVSRSGRQRSCPSGTAGLRPASSFRWVSVGTKARGRDFRRQRSRALPRVLGRVLGLGNSLAGRGRDGRNPVVMSCLGHRDDGAGLSRLQLAGGVA